MNREECIAMSVGGLTLDPVTKAPIVVLRDADNKLNLPIWIGLMEATPLTPASGLPLPCGQPAQVMRRSITR